MARYEVKSPQGDIYEITAPDTATQEQVLAYAQSQFASQPQKPAWGDVIAGLPATRFAMGMASPYIAFGQLGANLGSKISGALGGATTGLGSGEWVNQKLAEYEAAKQRGMKAAGKEGYDWMGLAGSLLPAAKIAAGVSKALPAATTLPRQIGVGALQGGAVAGTMPVSSPDFWTKKAQQTAGGAAIGGGVPVVGKGLEVAGNFLNPVADLFRKEGPANFLRRYHQRILGEQAIPKVTTALRGAKPIVSGSQPTAAEAVSALPEGSPLISAQKITARTPGGPSASFGQRYAAQQAARERTLQRIAPKITPESAIAKRTAESKQNYEAAFQDIVKADKHIKELLHRPSVTKALTIAKNIAKEEGITFPVKRGQYGVRQLHYVKLAMDDMIRKPELYALGKAEQKAIMDTRGQLLEWMDAQSNAYKFARAEHARLSDAVNRSQVRDYLGSKLTSPTGAETPGSFIRTLDDAAQLLKKSTGHPRYTKLEQVLPPKESKLATNIAKDLERSLGAQKPLQPTDLPGGVDVSKEVMPHLPALLSRPVVVTNWLLNKLGKQSIEPQIDLLATQQYLNPLLLAKSLQQPPVNPQVARMLANMQALAQLGGATAYGRQ